MINLIEFGIFTETLRHWPAALKLDRKCVKPYTLPPSNESDAKEVKVKTETQINPHQLGLYLIHRPDYKITSNFTSRLA